MARGQSRPPKLSGGEGGAGYTARRIPARPPWWVVTVKGEQVQVIVVRSWFSLLASKLGRTGRLTGRSVRPPVRLQNWGTPGV